MNRLQFADALIMHVIFFRRRMKIAVAMRKEIVKLMQNI